MSLNSVLLPSLLQLHRRCLLLCISRIVQGELDDFVEYWNTHKLRKNDHADCPQGIPSDLYDMPETVGRHSKYCRGYNYCNAY